MRVRNNVLKGRKTTTLNVQKGEVVMRIRLSLFAVLLIAGLIGCSDRGAMEKEVADLRQKNSQLSQDLSTRDQYIEDIVSSINNVYGDLETARAKEKQLLKETQSPEQTRMLTSAEVRQQVLHRISDISSVLAENRKRIVGLETKLRSSRKQFEGLNAMVASLKQSLQEREQNIAQLESNLKDLTAKVEEKTKEVADKEATIHNQQTQMNTAYYIVGTRKELEEKGIIHKEGGFLWGLLGSTTVLASGFEPTYFKPVDKTSSVNLPVDGTIDEIIPRRNPDFYQTEPDANNSTTLRIVDPQKFWQDKYLVIITG